jgi:hypothetical protein
MSEKRRGAASSEKRSKKRGSAGTAKLQAPVEKIHSAMITQKNVFPIVGIGESVRGKSAFAIFLPAQVLA